MRLVFDPENKYNVDDDIIKSMEECGLNTLLTDGFETDCEVSLAFVSDSEIKDLNLRFRNIAKPTDVLSFPQIDFDTDREAMVNEREEIVLGDIVISYETAKRQAIEYGHSLKRELCFLFVHSMLHLLGYDHTDEESERKMFDFQEEILYKSGIIR